MAAADEERAQRAFRLESDALVPSLTPDCTPRTPGREGWERGMGPWHSVVMVLSGTQGRAAGMHFELVLI